MNIWYKCLSAIFPLVLTGMFFCPLLFAQDPAVKIELKSPLDGKTYTGAIAFRAVIKGGSTDQYLTVTVACFDAVRYVSLLPSMSLMGQMPEHAVDIEQWPVTEGRHRLRVMVHLDGKKEAQAEEEITFTVTKDQIDAENVARIRENLYRTAQYRDNAERAFSIAQSAFRLDPNTRKQRDAAAEKTHGHRLNALQGKMSAISDLAMVSVSQFAYEKAVKIMDSALAVYLAEIENCAVHPLRPNELSLYRSTGIEYAPVCYERLAEMNTFLGNYQQAVWGWEMVISWYVTQLKARADFAPELRRRCIKLAGDAYEHLSDVHILLRNNRTLATACRENAALLN